MLKIPESAIKTYDGKSKDVWKLEDGSVILDFNKNFQTVDPITGLPDPGANSNGKEEVPGLGRTNLALTYLFFKLFESLGIKTQLIDADIEKGLMHVKNLEMYGKGVVIPELSTIQPIDRKKGIETPYWHTIKDAPIDGIEMIARRRFTGSYHNAFPNAAYDMMGIHPEEPAFVEFTVKNDDLGDPRISSAQLISNGIMSEAEVEEAIHTVQEVERISQAVANKCGLEEIDFKIECGKSGTHVHVADEFATGSWRMRGLDGSKLDKFQVASALLGKDIVQDIRDNKLEGMNERIMNKTLTM